MNAVTSFAFPGYFPKRAFSSRTFFGIRHFFQSGPKSFSRSRAPF